MREPGNPDWGHGRAEDFHRDFLPRFIDARRAFHDGDPEPNLALWSIEDPVTLFAARGLVDSGTEPVTETFRFVASTFSDVGTRCSVLPGIRGSRTLPASGSGYTAAAWRTEVTSSGWLTTRTLAARHRSSRDLVPRSLDRRGSVPPAAPRSRVSVCVENM
jgi:hypothetical protein